MNTRLGKGKGLGCGYYNISPMDSHVHSLSAKGIKTWERTGMTADPTLQNIYGKKGKQDVVWIDNWKKGNYAIVLGKEVADSTYKETGIYTNTRTKEEALRLQKEYMSLNGKSIPAYTCPCGFVGTKGEFSSHRKNCDILKKEIEKDEKFKRELLEEENKDIGMYAKGTFNAGEILRQLGGNRFIAMTGAKDFAKDDAKNEIVFKIGRNAKSVNYVRIKLTPMDTYDMEFLNVSVKGIKVKSKVEGVYNDQLQDIFTENTGMYTQL